jgi:hypothetical protein
MRKRRRNPLDAQEDANVRARMMRAEKRYPASEDDDRFAQRTYLGAKINTYDEILDDFGAGGSGRTERLSDLPLARNNPPKKKRRANPGRKAAKDPKAKGVYEHLRVRQPASFTEFRTQAWAFTRVSNAGDADWARKKLGIRTIPTGAKVVIGKFKKTAKGTRPKGKKGNYLAWGIQAILVPIKGGKRPMLPRGAAIPKKTKARKAVARARKNPVGKKTTGDKFTHVHVRSPISFVKSSFKTVAISHANPRDLKFIRQKAKISRLPRGAKLVVGKFKPTSTARTIGKSGKPLVWGIVKVLVPIPKSKQKKSSARRKNPGTPKLMIQNPLPKKVADFRRRLNPGERKGFDKAIKSYVEFHGKVPTKITRIGNADGKTSQFWSGMGKAVDVSYSANGKGFQGSDKKGIPWRHAFEANPFIAKDHNGRIVIGNQPSSRKKMKVTDFIRG